MHVVETARDSKVEEEVRKDRFLTWLAGESFKGWFYPYIKEGSLSSLEGLMIRISSARQSIIAGRKSTSFGR